MQAMRSLVKRDERFSVLDVGAGSGDAGAMLQRYYGQAEAISLDRRELHLQAGSGRRVAGDAFHLPFRPGSFDFVVSSLFLHHFGDAQIADLLAQMRSVARRAVVVVDLERHPIAYYFLPATRHLLRWHDVTVNDGCISVEAGFRAEELERIARAAGAADPKVRRHRPWFRLSLVMAA